MREIQRIGLWRRNYYPFFDDGIKHLDYPFHKEPGLFVFKHIADQNAPDTYVNLHVLFPRPEFPHPENIYDQVRLANENSLVLSGPLFNGKPIQNGNCNLERHPSGLFVSKYEPKLESLGDLLKVDDQFGEPIEFSRVESRGGKRKWSLASETERCYARRTCFVTPLYRSE